MNIRLGDKEIATTIITAILLNLEQGGGGVGWHSGSLSGAKLSGKVQDS